MQLVGFFQLSLSLSNILQLRFQTLAFTQPFAFVAFWSIALKCENFKGLCYMYIRVL